MEHKTKKGSGGRKDPWHFNAAPANVAKMAQTIMRLVGIQWFVVNHKDGPVSGNGHETRIARRTVGASSPISATEATKIHKASLARIKEVNEDEHKAFVEYKKELAQRKTLREDEMQGLAAELASFSRPPRMADMFRSRVLSLDEKKQHRGKRGYPECLEREHPRPGATVIGTLRGGVPFGPVKSIRYVSIEDDTSLFVRVPSQIKDSRDAWIQICLSGVQFADLLGADHEEILKAERALEERNSSKSRGSVASSSVAGNSSEGKDVRGTEASGSSGQSSVVAGNSHRT